MTEEVNAFNLITRGAEKRKLDFYCLWIYTWLLYLMHRGVSQVLLEHRRKPQSLQLPQWSLLRKIFRTWFSNKIWTKRDRDIYKERGKEYLWSFQPTRVAQVSKYSLRSLQSNLIMDPLDITARSVDYWDNSKKPTTLSMKVITT